MLIDNRSNQVSDFREAMAVTAVGRVKELSGNQKAGCCALSGQASLSERICGVAHLRPAATGGPDLYPGGTVSKSAGMAPETLKIPTDSDLPVRSTRRTEGRPGGRPMPWPDWLGPGSGSPISCASPPKPTGSILQETGLGPRIFFELQRKPFEEMRWEEIWDAALRIRNLFLNQPVPPELEDALKARLEKVFGNRPVVVRSSGIGEDSAGVSFAGLHESFVNIRGANDMLEHIRLVWASLWSDRALLYRQELGLDIEHSAMPVVIQALIQGDRSGVAFSQNPNDPTQAVIEAVYGLNQGLVDGTVEPDRWILDRDRREGPFPSRGDPGKADSSPGPAEWAWWRFRPA